LLGENLEAEKSLFRRKELFECMKIFCAAAYFCSSFSRICAFPSQPENREAATLQLKSIDSIFLAG
jgi:hypothetical protein